MTKIKTILISIIFAFAAFAPASAYRQVRTINSAWTFTQDGKEMIVNLPHTWNALDIQDDEPGYWRGLCTYRKTLVIDDDMAGKNVFIRFEGANQEAELIVNGTSVGKHIGGYSAFSFDVTDYMKQGANDIVVKLDNKHDVEIAPLSADFSFLGGIYRDVELIITASQHVSVTHYGSTGVYISTPEVSAEKSVVGFKTYLGSKAKAKCLLEQQIYDQDSKLVASVST